MNLKDSRNKTQKRKKNPKMFIFCLLYGNLKTIFLVLSNLIVHASFHGSLINQTSKNSVTKTSLQQLKSRGRCHPSELYFQVIFNDSH